MPSGTSSVFLGFLDKTKNQTQHELISWVTPHLKSAPTTSPAYCDLWRWISFPHSADSAMFLSFKARYTDVDVQLIGRLTSYMWPGIQQLAKLGDGDFPNRTYHAIEVHFCLATSVSMFSSAYTVADLPTPMQGLYARHVGGFQRCASRRTGP